MGSCKEGSTVSSEGLSRRKGSRDSGSASTHGCSLSLLANSHSLVSKSPRGRRKGEKKKKNRKEERKSKEEKEEECSTEGPGC